MKDYNVQIKVKNNLLYKAMLENGYNNVAEISRASGVSKRLIYRYMNLKTGIYSCYGGELKPSIIKLANFLKRLPEDLMPAQHHYIGIEKNTAEVEMSLEDMPMLSDENTMHKLIEHSILKDTINDTLDKLTKRQAFVINNRFGLNNEEPKTLGEIANILGCGSERIRQIEGKALRKIRLYNKTLKDFHETI